MGKVDALRLLGACYLEAVSSVLRAVAERLDPDKPSSERERRERHLDELTRLSQECGLYDSTKGVDVAVGRTVVRDRVIQPTRGELHRRRDELLSGTRAGYEDLKERAECGELYGDEWRVWSELEGIEFLLGAETDTENV